MPIMDAFKGKFFKAADIGDGEKELVIESCAEEELKENDGTVMKFVLHFEGEEQGLVLNKTNAGTLARQVGPDETKWGGTKVRLFTVDTEMGLGIRVKAL